jgi:hypothetical protein
MSMAGAPMSYGEGRLIASRLAGDQSVVAGTHHLPVRFQLDAYFSCKTKSNFLGTKVLKSQNNLVKIKVNNFFFFDNLLIRSVTNYPGVAP